MGGFASKCGFTHSDEITILIAPAGAVNKNGVHHTHSYYNGRVQKICSLAAATMSAHFSHGLMQLVDEDKELLPHGGATSMTVVP